MKKFIPCILLLAVPAYSVPRQSDIAGYRALIAQDQRLATVGYRLASANAAYCAKTEPSLGWTLHDLAQYPDQALAHAAFGFALPFQISGVAGGGPAQTAGLRADDALIRIVADSGELRLDRFPELPSRPAYDRLAQIQTDIATLLRTNTHSTIIVQYMRGQTQTAAQVQPELQCDSQFQIDVRDKIDAGADGDLVRVTSGMMNYVADDNELAAVVAHELSHNLLSHPASLAAVKYRKTSAIKATEDDADRLSIWLMHNAGYDPNAALLFWGHYGRQYGLGVFTDGTHRRWKQRVAIMQRELDQIAASQTKTKLYPPLLKTFRAVEI